jgi:hypothetical protein
MKINILSVIFILLVFCSDENPVRPQNHSPEILSLDVFPDVVKPSDSLIVICEAIDPDGDTLVYDWITTGVVRIKGAFSDDHWLYHTSENTRIFYAPDSLHVSVPQDTFWIQCFARDVKGGSAAGIVLFIVKHE